jgi:O-antigen ligase
MTNSNDIEVGNIGLKKVLNTTLYILLMMFIASTIMFTSESNNIYGKLMDVLFISFFFLYNLIYPQKTYYINSIIVIYFLFFVYAFSSIFWTVDSFYTLFTAKRMFFVWVNLVIILNVIKLYNMYSAIIYGMIIGVFFNLFLSFELVDLGYQVYGSELDLTMTSVRFRGSTFQPNMLGGICVFTIMGAMLIMHYAKNRLTYIVPILAIFSAYYLIMLTISRASLVIASVLLLIFLMRMFLTKSTRGYFLIASLIIFMFASYYIDFQQFSDTLSNVFDRLVGLFSGVSGGQADSSTSERMKLLKMATQIFKENPFFGTGLDTMRVLLFDGLFAHNTYIELLATLGPIGFLLYYSIHILIIRNIFLVDDLWLKFYLLAFMGVIFLGDFAGVNYYSKYVLILLLLFNHLAEENIKKREKYR